MSNKLRRLFAVTIALLASAGCNWGSGDPTPAAAETAAPPATESVQIAEEQPAPAPATATPRPTPTPTDEPIPASLTAGEMYQYALARAKRWQTDAVLVTLTTNEIGPLKPNGQSESWTARFWSPSAQAVNTITATGGQVATSVAASGPPRPVDAGGILFNSKEFYDLAAASGGQEYLALGYVAAAELAPYPLEPNQPVWYIHYRHPQQQSEVFRVIIEGSTGKIIQATPMGKLIPVN